LNPVLDAAKVRSHLKSVHRHNFKGDLSAHSNPQRSTYAIGREGGLLLCTWPLGNMPSLPFVYSNEVWTGIEYQAASHMIMMGLIDEGLEIVRACRARYDGTVRNPFDEYEWGHWYARAMASYALIQAFSGARFDAVDGVMHLQPSWASRTESRFWRWSPERFPQRRSGIRLRPRRSRSSSAGNRPAFGPANAPGPLLVDGVN
jgi:hypothetical protein